MRRGTTPTLEFTLPFEVDVIANCVITFAFGSKTILEKQMSDCVLQDNKITVELTQEETLQLPESSVLVQIKCKTIDNKVIASNIITVPVAKTLNEEIIE